jgi:hypothetical protein
MSYLLVLLLRWISRLRIGVLAIALWVRASMGKRRWGAWIWLLLVGVWVICALLLLFC